MKLMNLENQKMLGTNEVHLTDSLNASLLEVKIKLTKDTVVPETNDLFIYVDKNPATNPSADRKQYLFDLNSTLKYLNNVTDEFNVKLCLENNDAVIKAFVIRNIVANETGTTVLETPITEELEGYPLTLFEGENYIYTNYENASIEVIYPKDDDLNRMFLNNAVYYGNKLNKSSDFSLDDIYFKDAFTKTEDKLNLEVNNAAIDCLTSRNNKFSLDSEGNLIVKSITSEIQTNIAGEVILENDAPVISINNLDALNEGGVYEFIAIGYTNSTISTDIKIQINGQTSGYHHSYINASGTLGSSGGLTSRANYVQGVDDINEWFQTNGPNNAYPVIVEGRVYISENSAGQKKVNYTFRFHRAVQDGQSLVFGGGVFSQNFDNINSISLSLVNTSIKFAKGSRLTVFNPLKGAKGKQGEKSDLGPSNTLTIGTVEKGDEPMATLTGESPNQVLNLVLPKGEKGDAGGTMTTADVESLIENRLGTIYPVGSIYMSVNSADPSTLFGGTWEQLKDQFLLGAGDTYAAGTTGGSASMQAHTHSIPSLSGTANNSGNHNHVTSRRTSTYGSGMQANWRCITAPGSANGDYNQVSNTENGGEHTHSVTTNANTSGTAGVGNGENMPPYLAVYMWKRIG